MRLVVATVSLFLAATLAPAAVLLLPGVKEPSRLRLDVVLDGQPPATAWNAFLDRLFDFFDNDNDGALGQAEASRLPPLPLPGRKVLTIDFSKLDADSNGKASRAGLKSYCQTNGFGPIVTVVEPPTADDLRLADMLSRRLDADGDGQLSAAELRRAPESLRKFDLNEDESLDLAELLASAPPAPRPVEARVKTAETGTEPDATLRVDAGAKAPTANVDSKTAGRFRLTTSANPGGLHRLHSTTEHWAVTFRARRAIADVGSTREFLLAQLKASLGERTSLTKAELEEDATLSGLTELFRYADRNLDNRLSSAEVDDYLKLVELGIQAQIWVHVSDRDKNPFPLLDADGDGRLSYREVAGAHDLLSGVGGESGGLPEQFQLSFGGPTVSSWGGVPIPAARRPRAAPAVPVKAPRWFQAMDHNGDGLVSVREFLGPPEVFRKLDADEDGAIAAEEAARSASVNQK